MIDMKQEWKRLIAEAVAELAREKGIEPVPSEESVILEIPPRPELGDLAFPMFPYARILRAAPPVIAGLVRDKIVASGKAERLGGITQEGPYLNVVFSRTEVARQVLAAVEREGDEYGKVDLLAGQKVMVEFSCPNTNKPLHLGHMRNDAIGESVARILAAAGADVRKVNLINDRGIHICKSMLAYLKFGEGRTPEDEGLKSDHFVGKYYVKFNEWVKSDPSAEEQARQLLREWEQGKPEVVELWKTMNAWTVSGIEETYRATGISFDTFYYESETYQSGRSEVLKGLAAGSFYREEDGSVQVDLSEINLDKKVLLRSDGTTLYLTQDIGTAIARHGDWPFDRLIYVVASEQQYHFRVLFYVLQKLGFEWAKNLFHLSYGMVLLPEGKMKSREGTVVDADELFRSLVEMAAKEIREKEREEEVGDVEEISRSVALAALNYYLLQVNPQKDMVFNPAESISFNGNTGPYLQYMGARISSMLRKYEERREEFAGIGEDLTLLRESEEWELVKLLSEYPRIITQAAENLAPSAVATYLFDVAKVFSRYYHDHPILNNPDRKIAAARMALVRGVLGIFRNAFRLIGIPFLTKM